MNKSTRIVLHMRGLDEDNGDVRLNDFIQGLENLKKALIETQKLVSGDSFAYFKIVELHKNSPAQVVLEPVPCSEDKIVETESLVNDFFKNVKNIQLGIFPENFTFEAFEAYKDITSLRDKNRVLDIGLSQNDSDIDYLQDFSKKIDIIMGKDEFEFGSYTGMLDAINIHNQNIFYVYPTNRFPKLKCIFSQELKNLALSAVGKYVTVVGQKRLMPNVSGSHPHEMNVKTIEIHPDETNLPSLKDLKGIAPNITRKQSELFVRGIRNEW